MEILVDFCIYRGLLGGGLTCVYWSGFFSCCIE